MRSNSSLPIVRVVEINVSQVPVSLRDVGYGCYHDDDDHCGQTVHIWVVPADTPGGKRYFRAVTRNTIATEVEHRGTVHDLVSVVLRDHETEDVVFEPGNLA